MRALHPCPTPIAGSAFAGFCFPPEVIVLAVRWYLRFGLSYRDVEELLAERGVDVDHVTIFRWVQRFTPLLADAARPCRHAVGDRWQADETYVKVAGQWRYVYRAVDQFGGHRRVHVTTTRRTGGSPVLRAGPRHDQGQPDRGCHRPGRHLPIVLDELLPAAWHRTEQYANNHIEADHGRLKAWLRPMRGLKRDHSARVVVAALHSCKTSAAATTSWRLRSQRTREWPWRSTNWPW
jgi:transposase-like protein